MKYHKIFSQKGFSLIEVLVSVLVLAVGLLAVGALQAGLIKRAAESRIRTQMVNVQDLVLEHQRSAGVVDFQNNIASRTGNNAWVANPNAAQGTIERALAVAQEQAGVSNLRVEQNCTHYVVEDGVPSVLNDTCTNYNTTNSVSSNEAQFKNLDLTISWTNSFGDTKTLSSSTSISLRSIMNSRSPVDLNRNGSNGGKLPVVRTNSPEQPGVIPIAMGENTDTAATNPRPEILSGQRVGIQFEILTYQNVGNNVVRNQRRVENKIISCQCQPGDSPDGDFAGTAQWPAVWNGERYIVFTPNDNTPAPGTSKPTSATNASTNDELCTDCCRDHHDTSSTSTELPRFSPYTTGQHQNYRNNTSFPTEIATGNQPYWEACRMIRVDGMWRTAADLDAKHFGLLETENNARSYVPAETAKTNYEQFVLDFLKQKYEVDRSNPETSTANANTMFDNTSRNLNVANINIGRPAPIDTRYLHARSLYVDYLIPSAQERIRKEYTACTKTDKLECILPFLPFTTLNATDLANWAPNTTGTISVTTGAPFSDTVDPLRPSRGRVDALASSTNGASANAVPVFRKSNSGAAVMAWGINPADAANTLTDQQRFTATTGTGGGGNVTGPGVFAVTLGPASVLTSVANTSSPTDSPKVFWISNGSDVLCDDVAAPNPNPYTCRNVPDPNTNMTIKVTEYNGKNTGGVALTGSRSITCRDGNKTYTGTQNVTTRTCPNYRITSARFGSVPGNVSSAVNDGRWNETTNISFPAGVANNGTISVSFELTGSSIITTGTCQIRGSSTYNGGFSPDPCP